MCVSQLSQQTHLVHCTVVTTDSSISYLQEDTVVVNASDSAQSPKVYLDAPEVHDEEGAGFLPSEHAPLILWSDQEDTRFTGKLQSVRLVSVRMPHTCSYPPKCKPSSTLLKDQDNISFSIVLLFVVAVLASATCIVYCFLVRRRVGPERRFRIFLLIVGDRWPSQGR